VNASRLEVSNSFVKNRGLYFGIAAILLMGISVAAIFFRQGQREPVYKGHALSEWLTDLGSQNFETRSNANVALREMGPQIVPLLIADLNRHDSLLKSKTIELLKLNSAWRPRLMSESQRHQRSIQVLRQLKPHSKEVIAALNPHLLTTNVGIMALNALIPVGNPEPIGAEMVESLIVALRSADVRVRQTAAASQMHRLPRNNPAGIAVLQQSLGDPDKSVQLHAALGLTRLSTNGAVTVPAYIKLFRDHPGFERTAIDGCVKYETDAAVAVPMLMKAASGEVPELRQRAVYALGRIHSDAERVLPFLVGLLEDKDDVVGRNAAYAIGAFGWQATNAIPALLKAKESKNEQVREAVDYVMKNMLSLAKLEKPE
jgi:HEAT repeat protein